MHLYGRGSPRRGSRKRDPEKETEINRAPKNPQHKIPLWKSIQHIDYTKPPKFSVPSFRRVLVRNLTMMWVRPTAPLLATLSWFIRTIILRHAFPNTKILQSFSLPKSGKQKWCICKNTQIHSLFLQRHSWPLNQKHYQVPDIQYFPSIILNPTLSTLINIV